MSTVDLAGIGVLLCLAAFVIFCVLPVVLKIEKTFREIEEIQQRDTKEVGT